MLQSLDLAHEVLSQGCQMHEVAFWNPGETGGIERTAFVPDVGVPARFPHEITIHQGRIERVLGEDLEKHGGAVQRGWTVTGFEVGDGEWPVRVRMRGDDGERAVRCKYLVGADGAHSVVRRGMGLSLEGDTTDHIWYSELFCCCDGETLTGAGASWMPWSTPTSRISGSAVRSTRRPAASW